MVDTFDSRDHVVLYVDDEDANLIVFQAAFEDEFNVVCAESGQAGLAYMADNPVSVVISDFRMPGMNGVEFLEAVRLRHPTVVRLMATAFAEPQTAIAAINRAGVHHFIQKPFDDQYTRTLIRSAFQQAHMDLLVQRLQSSLIQQERLTGLAAAQRKFIHDLANVNSIVDSCCQVLQDLVQDRDDLGETFSEVMADLQRVLTYFNDLHGRSQDVSGTGYPDMHGIDEIIEASMRIVARKGIGRIKFVHQRTGLRVYANRLDVGRILVNLMTNASQALCGATARPMIEVSTRIEDDTIAIVVRDNGPGIPEEVQARIFENGFTTRAGLGGTGLGLAISSELAHQNGGRLTLESVPENTVFTLFLPSDNSGPAR